MERTTIAEAVLEAVAEAYDVDKAAISETTEYKKIANYSSSKVLKAALFIGENLDLEEDLGYGDISDDATIADTVEMLLKKLG